MRSAVTGKELRLLGGAVCLDFVNTIDPRYDASREDFLWSFEQLVRWARFVGLLRASEERATLAEGTRDPVFAAEVHRRALELRDALYRLLRSPNRGSPGALAILNRELQETAVARVARRRGQYHLTWRAHTVADSLLGSIARSAADLLTSPDLARVRECAGDGCGWLFLDTSKAHRRRWCSMATCGNRAKAQRHRRAKGATASTSRRSRRRPRPSLAAAIPEAPRPRG